MALFTTLSVALWSPVLRSDPTRGPGRTPWDPQGQLRRIALWRLHRFVRIRARNGPFVPDLSFSAARIGAIYAARRDGVDHAGPMRTSVRRCCASPHLQRAGPHACSPCGWTASLQCGPRNGSATGKASRSRTVLPPCGPEFGRLHGGCSGSLARWLSAKNFWVGASADADDPACDELLVGACSLVSQWPAA